LFKINLLQESKEHYSINEQNIQSPIPHHHHISNGIPSFKLILVAYDGTEISKRALEYASYISKIANSEIVIINIIEDKGNLEKTLPITIKANPNEESTEKVQIDTAESQPKVVLDESLQNIVKEITTACKESGITKEITYKIGGRDPADEIINVCKLFHFDLIIMGSRKIASRIGGIGSTTRKVASTVKIPILIVQKQPKYKDEY
jgi:nucleotide-binding universal stress UspA family protein